MTSRVWALERSTFFSLANFFVCLCLFREDILADVEPGGGLGPVPLGSPTPDDAPGRVAACCATRAELRRGFRVDVPARDVILSVAFICGLRGQDVY